MAGILKNILALGVSVGLSDREGFVNKLSGYIQAYQEDPAKAEQWAEGATKYLEQLQNNLRTQSNIESAIDSAGLPQQKSVEELTQAIKKLTQELQQLKGLK